MNGFLFLGSDTEITQIKIIKKINWCKYKKLLFFITKSNNTNTGRPCMKFSSTLNTISRVLLIAFSGREDSSPHLSRGMEVLSGDQNLKGEVILAIWSFFKDFFIWTILFEHSLKSKLAKECTKECEGKIMVLEQWLGLANLWCWDYWKNGSGHFYVWPPGKILPRVLITTKQREISHSPQTEIFRNLSPQQKGSSEKLCNGTSCLCVGTFLKILWVYYAGYILNCYPGWKTSLFCC